MVVALLLLSRLSEHTSSLVMNTLLLPGPEPRPHTQVLVIAVQNSADYADLGAATSGKIFFRSIGGAFGVGHSGAVVFSNRSRWNSGRAGACAAAGQLQRRRRTGQPRAAQAGPRPPDQACCTPTPCRSTGSSCSPCRSPPSLSSCPGSSRRCRCARPWRARSGGGHRGGLGAADSVDEIERALLQLADGDMRRRDTSGRGTGRARRNGRRLLGADSDSPRTARWPEPTWRSSGVTVSKAVRTWTSSSRAAWSCAMTAGCSLTPADGAADRVFAARRRRAVERRAADAYRLEQHAELRPHARPAVACPDGRGCRPAPDQVMTPPELSRHAAGPLRGSEGWREPNSSDPTTGSQPGQSRRTNRARRR